MSSVQSAVVTRLHDTIAQALAYAHAIADNAIDAGDTISADDAASIAADCFCIITALQTATNETDHLSI
jgi:hypothetical protein